MFFSLLSFSSQLAIYVVILVSIPLCIVLNGVSSEVFELSYLYFCYFTFSNIFKMKLEKKSLFKNFFISALFLLLKFPLFLTLCSVVYSLSPSYIPLLYQTIISYSSWIYFILESCFIVDAIFLFGLHF
eukprot:Sdes_comp16882_c1_seq1m6106